LLYIIMACQAEIYLVNLAIISCLEKRITLDQ
jgi:hypothetical protein